MPQCLQSDSWWFAGFGFVLVFLAACAAEPPVQATSSNGERLLRLVFEEGMTGGDPSILQTAVAAQFALHSRGETFTLTPEQLWHASQPIRTGSLTSASLSRKS